MTDPFAKSASVPSLSFSTRDEFGQLQSKPVGTRLGGKVTKSPEIVQETGYEGVFKGKLLFWDSNGTGVKTDQATTSDGRTNNPVNKIVVNVTTPQGEEASLWVSYYPKDMYEAIQEALAGRAIEKGDDLFVTITGKRPVPGKNPAHTYSADFTKGQGAFAPEQAAAATPPPPPAPVAVPAPPAPPAPAEAILSNGFTATQLVAAGWTAEQIAALSVPTAGSAPAAPAPASAPTASADSAPVDAAAARQAKIDAMTPEDRALLKIG